MTFHKSYTDLFFPLSELSCVLLDHSLWKITFHREYTDLTLHWYDYIEKSLHLNVVKYAFVDHFVCSKSGYK